MKLGEAKLAIEFSEISKISETAKTIENPISFRIRISQAEGGVIYATINSDNSAFEKVWLAIKDAILINESFANSELQKLNIEQE